MPFGFAVGEQYTRDQIADVIAMPNTRRGGAWDTGYDEWAGEYFIFANVGVPGRTGHDYGNRWDGQDLSWYGKTNAQRGQPQIDRIISNTVPVHVFWRGADRAPFTYAGLGTAVSASNDRPIQVLWSFGQAAAPVAPSSGPGATSTPPASPTWRRGPPPSVGSVTISRTSGPTDVYVLVLNDPTGAILSVPPGHVVIKVGMSNDVGRRVIQLNVSFPHGSKISWVHDHSRTHPDGQAAFAAESQCLEQLRRNRQWIGGEFAIVPRQSVAGLI